MLFRSSLRTSCRGEGEGIAGHLWGELDRETQTCKFETALEYLGWISREMCVWGVGVGGGVKCLKTK